MVIDPNWQDAANVDFLQSVMGLTLRPMKAIQPLFREGQQDLNSGHVHPNRAPISLCQSSELGQRDKNPKHANAIRTPLSLSHAIARFQSVERPNARH